MNISSEGEPTTPLGHLLHNSIIPRKNIMFLISRWNFPWRNLCLLSCYHVFLWQKYLHLCSNNFLGDERLWLGIHMPPSLLLSKLDKFNFFSIFIHQVFCPLIIRMVAYHWILSSFSGFLWLALGKPQLDTLFQVWPKLWMD